MRGLDRTLNKLSAAKKSDSKVLLRPEPLPLVKPGRTPTVKGAMRHPRWKIWYWIAPAWNFAGKWFEHLFPERYHTQRIQKPCTFPSLVLISLMPHII